jgi:hypothetical protein
MIGTANLRWRGDQLLLGHRLMATLQPYRGQWLVRLPDGQRSADFYNRARAKEHAQTLVLAALNKRAA